MVNVTMPDGTKRIGRDIRFTTERTGGFLRRKMTEDVAYLTDLNGVETRIGPIREMSWN